MDRPKLSIIFPIYNNDKYIEKSIRSVMNQTLKEIEMILIDDGSSDNSPSICDNLASEDERIKVIHKENEGTSASYNQGLDIAQGEYVAFVESDDSVAKDMYEKLYNLAIETSADIVKCGFYYCEEDFKYEARFFYNVAGQGVVFQPCNRPRIFRYHASIWAGIYNRSFINENKLRFIETPSATYSDFSWMAMTYAYAKRVTVFHEALYYYTYDNPTSSRVQEGEKCLYKPYHCLQANKILRDAGVFDKVKEEIGYSEYWTCQGHARKIKKALRNDYYIKYRKVMRDLISGGFSFKYFSLFDRYVAMLLIHDKENAFYGMMDLLNIRNNLYSKLKRVPFIKSIGVKYRQHRLQ